MGFLNGRLTFLRFRVLGESPLPFSDDHLERVGRYTIGGSEPAASADGVSVGWAGGNHVLDTAFGFEKNLLNDALHVALRIDTDKIPGELLRAYTRIELDALSAENPSGRPTKAQKEQAKEAAGARAEAEARDGRFRRRKHYPVLWDGRENILYAGTTSESVIERLVPLFRATFDRELEPITAGVLARSLARESGQDEAIEDDSPALFAAGGVREGAETEGVEGEEKPASGGETAPAVWVGQDPSCRDYWGNEFLVWLWRVLQQEGDQIELKDGSTVAAMLAKTLTLDCPLGQNGSDSMRDEGPSRLPEAFRALQSGKLPRKVGLVLVRHGMDYALTLQAESLAVSGLALPRLEDVRGSELSWARIDCLRHFVETLELLFEAFASRRLGQDWVDELGRIRAWLRAA